MQRMMCVGAAQSQQRKRSGLASRGFSRHAEDDGCLCSKKQQRKSVGGKAQREDYGIKGRGMQHHLSVWALAPLDLHFWLCCKAVGGEGGSALVQHTKNERA